MNTTFPFLSNKLRIVNYALVTSPLDYYNSLFAGLPASTLRLIQFVQNYAVGLLYFCSKYTFIASVLRDLHSLPIKFRFFLLSKSPLLRIKFAIVLPRFTSHSPLARLLRLIDLFLTSSFLAWAIEPFQSSRP